MHIWYKIINYGMAMIIGELIYRIGILSLREVLYYGHHHEEKPNRYLNILKKILNFQLISTIPITGFTVATIVLLTTEKQFQLFTEDFLLICLIYTFMKVINLPKNTINILEFIRNGNGADYGSGMAHNYFYGYLKIVLPSTNESQSKSIIERIEDYEAAESTDECQIEFPIKKLFILISESLYTPKNLESENLESSRKNLEIIKCNRAGIGNRTYHNSVYRIAGTKWYCVAEGASPLQTFYETVRANASLNDYRVEIVQSFSKTLKMILTEDLDCRDLCEIIEIKNTGGIIGKIDYGLIIKNRIMELKNKLD